MPTKLPRRTVIFSALAVMHVAGFYALAVSGSGSRERAVESPVEVVLLTDVRTPPPPPPVQAKLDSVKVDIPVPVIQLTVETPPPETAITVPVVLKERAPVAPVGNSNMYVTDVEYLHNPIRYPEKARKVRAHGMVELRVAIDAQGRATDVRVHHSSGFDVLDTAAVQAVREWRFRPREVGGVASPCVALVPVNFELPVRTASAS